MHGELGAVFFERDLQLLDEQPLAADLGQGAVEDLVAAGRHAEQLDHRAVAALQQVADMFGLPEGEAAFAGGDDAGLGQGAHADIVPHARGPAGAARVVALILLSSTKGR